ncbi:bifunctional oligoribonuclease/PAP phosphatase NrnA, partial [Patescibacteria group bacterium]|nr:bifunctional oligoribonuclease/PAP phosphatase NrnA [Patescibacteria group bacterium]
MPNNKKTTPKQQITEKIKNSQNVLLVTHVNPDGDALGSTLALFHTLNKLNKKVHIVASGNISSKHEYLPGLDNVKHEITSAKQFVITLDTSNTGAPHKVKYQTEDNKINLIITPDSGNFTAEDVSCQEGQPQFDLIIVTDTPNLERLDNIYDTNTELFYETPIINIDHHSDNDSFGEINLINSKSSSVSEIMISIIESLSTEQPLLDSDIATCILTGILDDTNSFQNTNTTPKSLTVAAQMMAAGADYPTIIKNLFKTQPLSKLRAWGKILTKLQTKPSLKLAWSTLSYAELQEMEATPDQTGGVIDALISNLPDIKVFLLLVQTDEFIKGSLRSIAPLDINPIASELGGGGHPQASGFKIYDKTLAEAEELVLNTIEKHLSTSPTTSSVIEQKTTAPISEDLPPQPETETEPKPPAFAPAPPTSQTTPPSPPPPPP